MRYWRQWAGDPGTAAGRAEGIERFSRMVAGPDPAGEWDRCRLVLGGLLANRAGQRLITGWIEPVTTGAGWADANAALELFERAAASPTLDADLRRRAKLAHARLSGGMAILGAVNAMTGGRAPDVGAVFTAVRRLANDQYEGMARLASGLIAQMSGRRAVPPPAPPQAIEGRTAGAEQEGAEQNGVGQASADQASADQNGVGQASADQNGARWRTWRRRGSCCPPTIRLAR